MTRSGFLQLLAVAWQSDKLPPQYASFKDAEIRITRDFFRPGGGNPPPSQVKKQALPANVAKNIRRGGTLPDAVKEEPYPQALASQLPPPPSDYQRILFHRWVLLVQQESRLIVDLIDLH